MTTYADSTILPNLDPTVQDWTLQPLGAILPGSLSRRTQRLARQGHRWTCRMSWDVLGMESENLRRLEQSLMYASDISHSIWVPDFRRVQPFNTDADTLFDSLIVGGYGEAGGWSDFGGQQDSYSTDGGWLLARNTAATPVDSGIRQQISGFVNAKNYHVRLEVRRVQQSAPRIRIGSTAGGSDFVAETVLLDGVHEFSYTVATEGAHWIDIYLSASGTDNDQNWVGNISVARSLITTTTYAAGVEIFSGAGSGNNAEDLLALAGTRVELNGTMYHSRVVTRRARASDNMLFHVTPSLRDAAGSGDTVILHRPMCQMYVPENSITRIDNRPLFSAITVDFVEV